MIHQLEDSGIGYLDQEQDPGYLFHFQPRHLEQCMAILNDQTMEHQCSIPFGHLSERQIQYIGLGVLVVMAIGIPFHGSLGRDLQVATKGQHEAQKPRRQQLLLKRLQR